MRIDCLIKVEELVKEYGMRGVLESLIEGNKKRVKEGHAYIYALILNLEATLEEYEDRYEED